MCDDVLQDSWTLETVQRNFSIAMPYKQIYKNGIYVNKTYLISDTIR